MALNPGTYIFNGGSGIDFSGSSRLIFNPGKYQFWFTGGAGFWFSGSNDTSIEYIDHVPVQVPVVALVE